jgi:hypothetical protein
MARLPPDVREQRLQRCDVSARPEPRERDAGAILATSRISRRLLSRACGAGALQRLARGLVQISRRSPKVPGTSGNAIPARAAPPVPQGTAWAGRRKVSEPHQQHLRTRSVAITARTRAPASGHLARSDTESSTSRSRAESAGPGGEEPPRSTALHSPPSTGSIRRRCLMGEPTGIAMFAVHAVPLYLFGRSHGLLLRPSQG